MTNNQLTDERIERLIRLFTLSVPNKELEDARAALLELQEHRKATAEPIYQLFDMYWYDTDKQTYDSVTGAGCAGRIVYAAPQPLTDAERTADREMLNRLAVIMSGSDTPGEIRSLTVTAQSLVDRCKQLARERGKVDGLHITLPDLSSKAFWSGNGKNEVFHPETYKRWVKEAIERDCIIAGIGVEVSS